MNKISFEFLIGPQLIILPSQTNMKQNLQFQFTGGDRPTPVDNDFKKQRAAYLAQRNAHKKQAKLVLQKQRKFSSSSEEEPPTAKKIGVNLRFKQKSEDNKTTLSPKAAQVKSKVNPEKDNFKTQRELYKEERLAHKKQGIQKRKIEFDSSSSDDDVPVQKPSKIILTEPELQKATKEDQIRVSLKEFESNPFLAFSLTNIQKNKKETPPFSARLKIDPPRKKQTRQRYEVQIPSRKAVNVWLQKYLQFKQEIIYLGERAIPIYDISKVKLFFTRTINGFCQVKLTLKQEDVYFSVDHKKLHQLCLDHYYYIFAKIISLKLQLMGKTPNSRQKLKISQTQQKGAQITGKVRKSSFFGGWQTSIGIINQLGLCLFKQNKQTPSLVINYNTVKQLWTRFDFDTDNLIMKFVYNSKKIELSIPFQNYLSRDSWLYHIYNLASK